MSLAWPRECLPSDHTSRCWNHDENQTHSPFGSRAHETDPCASSILVCSAQSGAPCAPPPDWAAHPCLKSVVPDDRRAFREAKLAEWLGAFVMRTRCECFAHYVARCVAAAEQELKRQQRLYVGDDFLHYLDKMVFKLFFGARMGMARGGVRWGVAMEELVLALLREEFAFLVGEGRLDLDVGKFRAAGTTAPWPDREDVALHAAQRVPQSLETFVEMDSR